MAVVKIYKRETKDVIMQAQPTCTEPSIEQPRYVGGAAKIGRNESKHTHRRTQQGSGIFCFSHKEVILNSQKIS